MVDNDSPITYAQATSGTDTLTHFGLGFLVSGAGFLDMVGVLATALAVSVGITPEFASGDLDVSFD